MNNFNLLITLISKLKIETTFSITHDWLLANGIRTTAGNTKSLGKQFAKVYSKYNCDLISKGSDNLRLYKKK